MFINDRPSALETRYPLKKSNQSIVLYEGTLGISQEGNLVEGNGTVYLKWFPYPHIEFELSCNEYLRSDELQVCLKLPEISKLFKTLISFSEHYGGAQVEVKVIGSLREPITVDLCKDTLYADFHLVNFTDFRGSSKSVATCDGMSRVCERMTFKADDWKITIDQLTTTTEDVKLLEAQGGYGITHVGRVQKISGLSFVKSECQLLLKALSDFLSFVRGFRVGSVLLSGYDSEDKLVWRDWSASDVTSWRAVNSWACGLPAKSFVQAFPGFLKWWKDWDESAKRVVHWYCESNIQAGAIEGACILEHAALELIAWTHLESDFESDRKLNKEFQYPSQKFNHLLSKQKIPQTIPSDLIALIKLANRHKWIDNGAYVFSQVRNSITHSAPENQKTLDDLSVEEREEAWELGLSYLELLLLSLFNYQGEYFNRLRRGNRYFGDLEFVPWKKNTMFDRITFEPQIMSGRACIRGMRVTVSLIVNLVANGMTSEEILQEYPTLEAEDIQQALQYAAFLTNEESHPLISA